MARDMRSWIARLEEAGELSTIKRPVDPRTEMGALLYRSRERGLFFQTLAGDPAGARSARRPPTRGTPRSPSTRRGPS
jgi:3-polyprenyl-4-hydroxybenzoate decarboxylase